MKKLGKVLWYGFIIIVVFLMFGLSIHAETIQSTEPIQSIEPIQPVDIENEKMNQDEMIDYGMSLLDWDSIEALEKELSSAMPDDISFHLKEEMQALMKGQANITVTNLLAYVMRALFNEVGVFIQFGARFILIVLLCNLLQTLSSSFKSKNTSKIAFFVCYMVILLSVVQSFRVMTDLAITVIDQMSRIMLVCVPILLAFMVTSGYSVSAGAMAPVVMSGFNLLTYIIEVIALPCIISVVVLEVISSMSEEFKVNKMIGLFYKGIKWGLRGILTISVSLLSLYRVSMGGVDMVLKKATVKFSSAFIPVVGSAVGGTIDFITSGSMLIKNTFSIGVIMWILILVSIPLIKIFAYVCVYQVAGAIIEPIGDKKMANIATKLGKGCQFMMSSVGIVALFCICTLVICMTISVGA